MDFKKILRKLDEFKIITMPTIFVVFLLFAAVLVFYFTSAYPAIEKYGMDLFITNVWKATEDATKEVYGLAAPIWGSIYTSVIAVILAIPIAIGYAIYVNDYAPEKLKYPLIIISDIMAGLPTVIYGIWGAFILVPFLRDNIMMFLYENFSYIPFFSTPPITGYGYLSAGVLLAIMVIPFASAIIREAYAMVP
ncbi:phosphate ABC transporter permease subunit PstC, partial [Methanothermococcus sp. SCGC AD-155-K20]|nr:phosphate ABC transporter permease subunit PstC [Methanothermococcus sp. SCGC AD-155-K20]